MRVYTLSYRGEAYFADSIFHLTTEQKTLAQNFAENLSLFLGDGLFQNLSSSESSFTIPALGNIRYTGSSTTISSMSAMRISHTAPTISAATAADRLAWQW